MKTVVTLIHGSKEHSKRYDEFIAILENNDIEVITGDLESHGENFTENYHHFTFDSILESTLKIIDKARKEYPDHKHIIMGHSMGSFIVKYIVYSNLRNFDAVILSGTNHTPSVLLNIAQFLTKIAPSNKVSKINEILGYGFLSLKSKSKGYGNNWLSSDERNEINFKNDPLCGNDFSNESLKAMYEFIKQSKNKSIVSKFKNKSIPQLLIYGGKDPVPNFGSEIKAMIKFQNKFGISNHTVINYPNSKHEILFDIEKQEVFNDVIKFIKQI